MVTDKQVKRLFKLRSMGMTKSELADKTNMDIKTASKYLDSGKLPSQVKSSGGKTQMGYMVGCLL